jgi:hypothetical protein
LSGLHDERFNFFINPHFNLKRREETMPTRFIKRMIHFPPHETYKNAKSIFSTHLFFARVGLKPSLQVKLLHTMAIFSV